MAAQKQTRTSAAQSRAGTASKGTASKGTASKGTGSKGTGAKGTGAKGRNRGTRGGRPDPAAPVPAGRRPGGGQPRPDRRPPGGQWATRPAGGEAEPASAGPAGAPLWLQLTTLVLSLCGLGVSIYLTIAHFTSTSVLACSDKGVVNCAAVTTSPEAEVFGIFPVAVLGLAFYVFLTGINTPWAWRASWPVIGWARVASLIAGIGFVLYLVYTEVFTLGEICLWCTAVHVVTFVLFALTMFAIAAGYGISRQQAAR